MDTEPRTGEGGRGGGDPVLSADLYLPMPSVDPDFRTSTEHADAASCLIGAAANRSFLSGQPVRIADQVTGLRNPAGAPMPDHAGSIPMPLSCGWVS